MAILRHKFRLSPSRILFFSFLLFITYKTLVIELYFAFLRNPRKIHNIGLVVGADGTSNNKNINIVPLRVVYIDHLITDI